MFMWGEVDLPATSPHVKNMVNVISSRIVKTFQSLTSSINTNDVKN